MSEPDPLLHFSAIGGENFWSCLGNVTVCQKIHPVLG